MILKKCVRIEKIIRPIETASQQHPKMNLWRKISSGCAGLAPSCREAARAQSEALEHPLPPAKRFGLRLHLLMCRWCRRYGEQIRFLRHAAHKHTDKQTEAMPQTLSPEARERLKRALNSKTP